MINLPNITGETTNTYIETDDIIEYWNSLVGQWVLGRVMSIEWELLDYPIALVKPLDSSVPTMYSGYDLSDENDCRILTIIEHKITS